MNIKVKRLRYAENLIEHFPETNFLIDYKEAFIGITDDGRSVYSSVLLTEILEKKHIPYGFTPEMVKWDEIYYDCKDEIDFLEDLWTYMFPNRPPYISRNDLFFVRKFKKVKEGRWFDLPFFGL